MSHGFQSVVYTIVTSPNKFSWPSMEIGSSREYDQEVEEDILFFEIEDIREGVEECSKSLIGRILADRPFSSGTMEAALGAI